MGEPHGGNHDARCTDRYAHPVTSQTSFGEQGARLTYGSYLQLSGCWRPAARSPTRRARRAAVHHHPPGLRAVVQAAAARGDRRPGRDAGRRRRPTGVVGPAPAAAHARHRAGAGSAGRRAGDDDPAGLPAVPADAGAGQRLPVRAVPRARVPLRRQGPGVRRAVPRADRRRSAAAAAPAGGADAVGRVPARARHAAACRSATTRRSPARCAAPPTTGPRTPTCGRSPRRCSSTTSWPLPGGPGTCVMVERMIGAKTGTGGSTGAQLPAQPARPALLPAALGLRRAMSSAPRPPRRPLLRADWRRSRVE